MAHEGGYSAELVPFCGLAIVERLAGVETEVRDTILQLFPEHMGQRQLQPHEQALIERVADGRGTRPAEGGGGGGGAGGKPPGRTGIVR